MNEWREICLHKHTHARQVCHLFDVITLNLFWNFRPGLH